MSEEKNRALVSRIWDEVWNAGNMNTVDEVLSATYVGHIPSTPGINGREAFKQMVGSYRTAFPDVTLTVDDLIADGDRVVARWTSRGTHTGPFGAIPASGNRIEVMGISIFLIVDGFVQEEWEGFDTMALMQQLGVLPAPGAPAA
jgi:steroid delta-isomerase-like uncharacterized protein